MLAVIVTTPAGSNPQAGAPNVTFGDPPPTPPDRGAPPKPTDASPAKVPAEGGVKVVITGTGFTGATSVTFDKLPAQFVVDSDTQITATAPDSTHDFTSSSMLAVIEIGRASSSEEVDVSTVTCDYDACTSRNSA